MTEQLAKLKQIRERFQTNMRENNEVGISISDYANMVAENTVFGDPE